MVRLHARDFERNSRLTRSISPARPASQRPHAATPSATAQRRQGEIGSTREEVSRPDSPRVPQPWTRKISPLRRARADGLYDTIVTLSKELETSHLWLGTLLSELSPSMGEGDEWDRERVECAIDDLAAEGRFTVTGRDGGVFIGLAEPA